MSASKQPATKLARLNNVHHSAYRCRDAEQTRWFYEEVLGLPLAAAMVFDHISGMTEPRHYMHLFFELGDGNFIAFFDDPDNVRPDSFTRKDGLDLHIALEAPSYEAMLAWKEHINLSGKTCLGPVDHEFVHSVYMYDPNGIQVEITSKADDYSAHMASEAEHADELMKKWTADTRAQKIALFGEKALDRRGH